MFFRRASAVLLVIVAALVSGAATFVVPVHPTTASADVVLIRDSDVVREDLYAAGIRIEVRGTVEGDLVGAALEEVRISGVIEGDATIVARRVVVDGAIAGSLRVVAAEVIISGSVGDDVVVAGFSLATSGAIGRDVLGAVVDATTAGDLGRDLRLQSVRDVRVGGAVGRDVEVNAAALRIADTAEVEGDVRYRAEAAVDPSARIGGLTIELGATPTPLRVRAITAMAVLVGLAALVVVKLATFWVAPATAESAGRLARRWATSLLWGLVAVILPPVVLVAPALVAGSRSSDLATPMVLAMIPLWLLYGAVLAGGLVVGLVPSSVALGTVITPRRSQPARFVVGLILLGLAWFVPWVGKPLVALAWLVGFGAWLRGIRSVHRSRQIGATEPSADTNTPTTSAP